MQIFSVTQFVEYLNTTLAVAVFPDGVAVEGEVTGYRVSQDKWIWFDIKDAGAVIPCFATVWQLRMPLEDGMQVRVFGTPKVHPRSGKFSLNVERVELMGEGALRRAYELLKKRLAEEGIFAPERKRPIPRFPRSVGLITSRDAAAYTDFLRIAGNRWGGVQIQLAHVQVQGRDAVGDIVGAFRWFNAHPDAAEVLVLTRGGGSLEDLQAFNSEDVVRAVFSSRIPVVVGVGHERDESLADLAADVRASTPTNAAELVMPDRQEVAAFMSSAERLMSSSMRSALAARRAAVDGLARRLENWAASMIVSFRHLMKDFSNRFANFASGIASRRSATASLAVRLCAAAGHWTSRIDADIAADERLLAGLDPRRLLSRGYALVRSGGRVVRDAAQVDIGETVDIQLSRGGLAAEVTKKI